MNQVSKTINKWKKFYIANMVMAIFTYFMIISLRLVNQLDGLWHSEFAIAGYHEISIGRWVWPYFDKLRFGLQTEPFCSVVALAIFALGNIALLELFEIEPDNVKAYLISFMFLVSTSISTWLTFRYTSITFAVPYLAAVLFVLVCKKGVKLNQGKEKLETVATIALAALCIVVSFGTYQAFFDCTALAVLVVIMSMMYKDKEKEEVIGFTVKSVVSIIIGTIVYYIGVAASQAIHNVVMDGYNGADEISVGRMIVRFPRRFRTTYYYFKEYFFKTMFRWNRLQEKTVFVALIMAVIVAAIVIGTIRTFRKNKVYGVLFILCGALLPVAANIVLFIATESFLSLQMTCGLAFFLPVCMCLVFEILEGELSGKKFKWANGFLVVLCAVIIYGNYISTQIDQESCREGRTATLTIAEEILDELIERGYADNGGSVCFVGMPVNNERFMYTEHFYLANNLMQFGDWGDSPSAHRQTWVSLYREYFGYFVQPCSEEEYEAITARDDVASMPMFPRQGSIANIDGITVVKISDNY